MEDLRVEIALQIINLKIVHLLKENNKDREDIKKELNILVNERDKIYELDEDIINKVYDVYLEEIKKNRKGNN